MEKFKMIKSKLNRIIASIVLMFISAAAYSESNELIQVSDDITLKPLAGNVWIHTSYTVLAEWGKVPANGMIVITDETLVVIDTPWNDDQTKELINWFRDNYKIEDVKVIVTHYHNDNLGGLNWVNQNSIESYSIKRTRELCSDMSLPITSNTLKDTHYFDFKESPVVTFFPGEGHTIDSICVYLPEEKILFGGCSVKALRNKGLGNTADANLKEWSDSLKRMKEKFPDAEVVIPGHGLEGNLLLIDHTLSMF